MTRTRGRDKIKRSKHYFKLSNKRGFQVVHWFGFSSKSNGCYHASGTWVWRVCIMDPTKSKLHYLPPTWPSSAGGHVAIWRVCIGRGSRLQARVVCFWQHVITALQSQDRTTCDDTTRAECPRVLSVRRTSRTQFESKVGPTYLHVFLLYLLFLILLYCTTRSKVKSKKKKKRENSCMGFEGSRRPLKNWRSHESSSS